MSVLEVYARTWAQMIGAYIGAAITGVIREIVVHTEAGADLPATATLEQEIRRLKAIHAFHRSVGWAGFGYNGQANPSGRLLEGRGMRRQGAHVAGHNHRTLGIVIPGHGDRTAATAACLEAIARWIVAGIRAGLIARDVVISPHNRYSSKTCPGTRVSPQLATIRRRVAQLLAEPMQEDWFTMATEAELRKVVREEIERATGGRKVGDDLRRIRLALRTIAAKRFGLPVQYDDVPDRVET